MKGVSTLAHATKRENFEKNLQGNRLPRKKNKKQRIRKN